MENTGKKTIDMSEDALLAQARITIRDLKLQIKETNHRFRNTLMMIISMMELEKRSLDTNKDRAAFSKLQDRVQTMSVIHGLLCIGNDISKINFTRYLSELTTLYPGEFPEGTVLTVENSLPDLYMPLATAIPLSLMVNEMVTNAVKHGFNPETDGFCIDINASLESSKFLCVKVRNNGRPVPDHIELDNGAYGDNNGNGFCTGFSLIRVLADQIEGRVTMKRGPFPEFTILSPVH